MQELEKIFAEIDNLYVDETDFGIECNMENRSNIACDNCYECIKEACKNIIRNHMNDGWIPVEKFGLPKDDGVYDLTIINGLEEYVSVRWQFLSGTHLSGTQHYVDGVHYWADNYRGDPINKFLSERVMAWRKKPEPYCPERSDK